MLDAGDTLVCYTDGVTEAQPGTGEEFSEERLIALLQRERTQSPDAIVQTVRREVSVFTGNHALDDDYTLMAIRRHAGPPAGLGEPDKPQGITIETKE